MTTAVNTQFIVGDETMRRVFRPARLTHLADTQAFLDAIEVALVNRAFSDGGQNSKDSSSIIAIDVALATEGYNGGKLEDRVAAVLRDLREAHDKVEEVADWPDWATKCLKIIRDFSGADGFDDATEGVDLPGELEEALEHAQAEYQEHVATFPKKEAELVNRIEKLQSELDTANALVHCVCGTRVDGHGIGDGHSPVSSYHHAHDQATARIAELEEENKALKDGFDALQEQHDELKHRMDGLEK